jgi:nucleotide-binding universal stress UspA family protein
LVPEKGEPHGVQGHSADIDELSPSHPGVGCRGCGRDRRNLRAGPTLVLPEGPRARPFELGTVAIAWDFSRAAARAISDAMPLLEKARKVRIVTVTNEKELDSKHSAEALAKNLARHGIDVVLDKVDANGRRIGEVLEAYTVSHQVDVLVMGAYGHARWREFILGGATKSLLSKPPLPILFSH